MMVCVFFLMIRRPPGSTRTDTLFPYTTLFRSDFAFFVTPDQVLGDETGNCAFQIQASSPSGLSPACWSGWARLGAFPNRAMIDEESMMARRKYVVGNWKMNGLTEALGEAGAIFAAARAHSGVDVALCPPFTLIGAMAALPEGGTVGGQESGRATRLNSSH